MLPYLSFWPQANGAGTADRTASPAARRSRTTTPTNPSAKTSAPCASDYTLRDRDSLSAAYTIDDGNSLIPLADPLFASYSALRMQVASLQETHIFSPAVLNTFRAGFSRAGFNLDSSLLAQFPGQPRFRAERRPRRHRRQRRRHHHRLSGITSAGPNNAAGVWNRRNLFTFTDDVQITQGHSPDQRRRLVSARAG